ncbi:hypothetical protein NGRA_0609 [Nosema granulosis]|uniref:Uncharacterized protein n=1 Tax=Nosema granulosis TaxID=83296 RepID=A0A9P6H136_9MICR|nr:hypothetical protein NGRA_0609 [Nosema granulosis]
MCLYFLLPSSLRSYFRLFSCFLVLATICLISTVFYIFFKAKPSIMMSNTSYMIDIKNKSKLSVTISEISYVKKLHGQETEMLNSNKHVKFPLKLKSGEKLSYTIPYSPNIIRIFITYRFMFLDYKFPIETR